MNKSEILIRLCFSLIGTPYKWGGNTVSSGLDCSGFVMVILRALGCAPPGDNSSQMIYDYFVKNENGVKSRIVPGTLLFFGKSRISHIGIALNDHYMFESGGGDQRFTDDLSDLTGEPMYLYLSKQIDSGVRIRPISNRRDLVDTITPAELVYFK